MKTNGEVKSIKGISIVNEILAIADTIPEEVQKMFPVDASEKLDYYLYR